MLDRIVQMIVDRLEPKIERIIQSYMDELRIEVLDEISRSIASTANTFNVYVDQVMPEIEKRLKKEITQQIVRGIKL